MNVILSDSEVELMWVDFSSVSLKENSDGLLVLQTDWKDFKSGTDSEIVWSYFDNLHSKGVTYLMCNL